MFFPQAIVCITLFQQATRHLPPRHDPRTTRNRSYLVLMRCYARGARRMCNILREIVVCAMAGTRTNTRGMRQAAAQLAAVDLGDEGTVTWRRHVGGSRMVGRCAEAAARLLRGARPPSTRLLPDVLQRPLQRRVEHLNLTLECAERHARICEGSRGQGERPGVTRWKRNTTWD